MVSEGGDGNVIRRPQSHFLDFVIDFVIDGKSLRHLIEGADDDYVTKLNRPWLSGVQSAVETLLGRQQQTDVPRDFPAGRVMLLVCKVDGDIGCGAVTAQLDVTPTEVTWSELRWDDGYDEPTPVTPTIKGFTFDRRQYEAAFADAYERVAAFPYDKLAHQGRRFLWPWQWGWRLPPRADSGNE